MERREVTASNERLKAHILSLARKESWEKNDRLIEESIEILAKEEFLGRIQNVYIVGHGTSFATAQNAQSLIAHIARVYARALHGYEMREYPEEFIIKPDVTLVIGITCGGNTESVKLALKAAGAMGAHTLLISNDGVAGCAEYADLRIKTDCNAEQKADVQAYSISHLFLLSASYRLGILLALKNGAADGQTADVWIEKFNQVREALSCLPKLFQQMEDAARWFLERKMKHFVVLGTGPNIGTKTEGALKICELCWKFGAGEELEDFAHGRFREVDGNIPLLILAPDGKTRDKVMDLLAGCCIADTPTVIFTDQKTPAMEKLADHIILMPEIEDEYLTPFLYVFPLWFLGFHIRNMENGLVGEKRFGLFAKDIDFKAHFNESGSRIK